MLLNLQGQHFMFIQIIITIATNTSDASEAALELRVVL
jgi:hypothetical protein